MCTMHEDYGPIEKIMGHFYGKSPMKKPKAALAKKAKAVYTEGVEKYLA